MRGRLGRNITASVVNAGAVIATSLASVPLILAAVGTDGYGVWTLGLAFVLYASILQTGIGPAVQRYTAVARGAGDEPEIGRLLWTSLTVHAAAGVLFGAILYVAGPELAGLFDIDAELQRDAETMFRDLSYALALALLAAGTASVLQGLERFPVLAVSAAAGSLAFLAGVLVLAEDHGLPGLAVALAVQQAVMVVWRLAALAPHAHRPRLVGLGTLKHMVVFSAKLQLAVLAELVNWQSDKLVVGLVAPASTVGQLGIGAQISDGGRLVAGAALQPIISSYAVAAGSGEPGALERAFGSLHRLWVLGVFGAAVIGAATLQPLIEGWLGGDHDEAALLGAFLVLGSAAGLMTGTGVAYLRAIGQPGLEARYGLVILALNLALTIPLALTVGATGVVAGTLGAYAAGSAYFFARLKAPSTALRDTADGVRTVAIAAACGLASFAWGRLMVELLPIRVSLIGIGLGLVVALLVYLETTVGISRVARARPARP